MRIFVLEDDPARIQYFERRLVGHDVTYADSCSQVSRFVPPYDLVLLDHDLGGRQLEDHEDCGTEFARHVRTRIGDATVLIHSFNPVGAMDMWRVLPHSYLAPFCCDRFHELLSHVIGGQA